MAHSFAISQEINVYLCNLLCLTTLGAHFHHEMQNRVGPKFLNLWQVFRLLKGNYSNSSLDFSSQSNLKSLGYFEMRVWIKVMNLPQFVFVNVLSTSLPREIHTSTLSCFPWTFFYTCILRKLLRVHQEWAISISFVALKMTHFAIWLQWKWTERKRKIGFGHFGRHLKFMEF